MNLVAGLFRFWWDFLVGDSIALAIGGLMVLLFGYLLIELDMNLVAQVALPLAVAVTIAVSLPVRDR